MIPREITDVDMAYWAEHQPSRATYTGPGEIDEGIEPCPAINLAATGEIAVAWMLDEVELVRLAKGGTLWLITRGYLPVHGFHVSASPHASEVPA